MCTKINTGWFECDWDGLLQLRLVFFLWGDFVSKDDRPRGECPTCVLVGESCSEVGLRSLSRFPSLFGYIKQRCDVCQLLSLGCTLFVWLYIYKHIYIYIWEFICFLFKQIYTITPNVSICHLVCTDGGVQHFYTRGCMFCSVLKVLSASQVLICIPSFTRSVCTLPPQLTQHLSLKAWERERFREP